MSHDTSSLSRKTARDLAFQFLYAFHHLKNVEYEDFEKFCSNFEIKADEYSWALCIGTRQNLPQIDSVISANSAHWRIERMPNVDLTILRLAGYEILFEKDMHKSIAINEAVELAKKYGSEDSAAFINGILDKFTKPS